MVKCEFCNNKKLMLVYNPDREKIEIQRCDDCDYFSSDLDAWKSVEPKIEGEEGYYNNKEEVE